ncbi:ABC transporter ATP-binding protein [Lactobacillus sp. ESL0679]|uniref:ATP-binding cassette domain-containing protein n=1 Tax=Lactobacillus sp. ESL0679 TaxID=2983209 RepID=UPI0023F8153F|nr:ABC transporter ATP-binding protein [Lactobacillus sp. ESL0679]MDF7683543.1 ABC transporter ATP-binding protein [Lactobacillus sp. ESL0679]
MSIKEIIRVNEPRAILILVIYIFSSFSSTGSQYLLKYAINAISNQNFSNFLFWIITQAVTKFMATALLAVATYKFNQQMQEYIHRVRDEILRHYYANGQDKISKIENELSSNMKILTTDYLEPGSIIVQSLLVIMLSISALFTLHWSLILATIIVAIIVFLLPKIMKKKLSTATATAAMQNSELLETISNWFQGLTELRRYHVFSKMNKELDRTSQALAQANIKKENLHGIAIGINGIGNTLGQIGIMGYALVLLVNHQIDFGSWVIATSFCSNIFNGLWDIVDAITSINSTKQLRDLTGKLRQFISLPQVVPVNSVQVKNLVVEYQHGEKIAYPDFTINAGDKVLLTGDSGSGKSTLLKVLLGELIPQQGQVIYQTDNGQVISPQNAMVGYIAQDSSLFSTSITDNITMFANNLVEKVPKVTEKMQLSADLGNFPAGLKTQVNLDQDNLSGGQKQKIVLARAAIREPQMLLLDEATSAIDSNATAKIVHELLQTKQTLLLIAHNFSPKLMQQFDYQINLQAKEGAK